MSADQRTRGVVLRTRPLTETSLIVHWLTPDLGRLATVAKGARRPKSPFRGKLDLFFEAEFSFVRSRRSDLHILREVALRDPHRALRQDYSRLEAAAYAVRLLERASESETPIPELHDLFCSFLAHLDHHAAAVRHLLTFELGLLSASGLRPDPVTTPLSADGRQALAQLGQGGWSTADHLQLAGSQADELVRFLGDMLRDHFDGLPPGREALLARAAAPLSP